MIAWSSYAHEKWEKHEEYDLLESEHEARPKPCDEIVVSKEPMKKNAEQVLKGAW